MKPGFNDNQELKQIDHRLTRQTAEFIRPLVKGLPKNAVCGDVGDSTYKIRRIEKALGLEFHQMTAHDFNYNRPVYKEFGVYDLITCLETLEHVQNALFFIKNISDQLKIDGVLILSLPARPRFLWTEHHYHEIKPGHLQKWILDELGLAIVRKKKIRINMPWWKYFTGIRPLFRLFLNYTVIYEIRFRNDINSKNNH